MIVVPVEIEQPGVTKRSVQFEDRPQTGLVVSVGDEISNILPGDVVFFGEYSHVKITNDDITYLIMRDEDVYCVADV